MSAAENEDLPNTSVLAALRALLERLWPQQQPLHFELHRASNKGDNYLGVVWRVKLLSHGSGASLVIKVPPQNSVRRKQFFARPCFLREAFAYEHFLPLAQEFQAQHLVAEAERFGHHALCYGSCLEEPNECIFLEDLCSDSYELHSRFGQLSAQHVTLVMRAYGKLHAVSLALKHHQPEQLSQCQDLVDIFEQRKEDIALGVYFEQLKINALDSLHGVHDAVYVKRLAGYFARGTFFELLLPLVNGANCEPYAVVCHGDCWNNNIMYKGQPTPTDVRLIDWQLMRYASPVTDLAYFFCTCTTREFRQQHYVSMLNIYYEEVAQQLERLDCSADQLFSRAAFEQQIHEKFAVGLLLAMMVLPIVTMHADEAPDLQAISELIEAGGTTNLEGAGFLSPGNEREYKRRMREVILDCVDNNYI